MDESCDESRAVVGESSFKRLGLADAAIVMVCSRGALVITDDLDLYVELSGRGCDVVNFNHIRPISW